MSRLACSTWSSCKNPRDFCVISAPARPTAPTAFCMFCTEPAAGGSSCPDMFSVQWTDVNGMLSFHSSQTRWSLIWVAQMAAETIWQFSQVKRHSFHPATKVSTVKNVLCSWWKLTSRYVLCPVRYLSWTGQDTKIKRAALVSFSKHVVCSRLSVSQASRIFPYLSSQDLYDTPFHHVLRLLGITLWNISQARTNPPCHPKQALQLHWTEANL